MDLVEKYMINESKLTFKNANHKKMFNAIYNSKKNTTADKFEISKPFMIKVLGIDYPGFQTSYRDRISGKTNTKIWAIDENGYDVYVPTR